MHHIIATPNCDDLMDHVVQRAENVPVALLCHTSLGDCWMSAQKMLSMQMMKVFDASVIKHLNSMLFSE